MRKIGNLKGLIVFLTICSAFLGSCVSPGSVKLIQEKVNKEMTAQFETPKTATYRLNVGDHLYIRVYSVDPKTSKFFQADFPYLMNSTYQYLNTYVVDEFGYISFSFIDKLYVKGLTVQEVQAEVQKQLDEYFKESTAFVKLVNFQISVLGEVNSPGSFVVEQDEINIFQALGLANGINDFGNLKEVKIVRKTQTGTEVNLIDLTDNQILASPYFYLMPDDIIYIEPKMTKPFLRSQFPYEVLVSFLTVATLTTSIILNLK